MNTKKKIIKKKIFKEINITFFSFEFKHKQHKNILNTYNLTENCLSDKQNKVWDIYWNDFLKKIWNILEQGNNIFNNEEKNKIIKIKKYFNTSYKLDHDITKDLDKLKIDIDSLFLEILNKNIKNKKHIKHIKEFNLSDYISLLKKIKFVKSFAKCWCKKLGIKDDKNNLNPSEIKKIFIKDDIKKSNILELKKFLLDNKETIEYIKKNPKIINKNIEIILNITKKRKINLNKK